MRRPTGTIIHTGLTRLFVCLYRNTSSSSRLIATFYERQPFDLEHNHLQEKKKSYLQPGYGRSPVSTSLFL